MTLYQASLFLGALAPEDGNVTLSRDDYLRYGFAAKKAMKKAFGG